ncbi:phenylacetic acid degradation protein PaaY [Klebsiella pneumoniae subsp. rhinoscleromatis]|nr:phenylacetic acid degradation protein PaaY [Klebsiella pneumoniae subsp. rhinoscleromatis]
MPIYQIDGLTPVVPEESYVHPTAVLIGDVILGKGVYVGPNASLRGDFGRIVVKDGANIQDNCVMHGFPGQDTVVEEEGHIGHGAILHGCVIGRNALVGHERGDYRRGGHWRKQHCRRFGLCQSQRRDARQPSDYRQPGKSDSHPERTGAGVEKTRYP